MVFVEPGRRAAVPNIDDEAVGAGFRTVFRITEAWGLNAGQERMLLGSPARSTFYKWKQGEIGAVPHDTVRRLSYILGIYKALQILYRDPAQADQWITRTNTAFGGQSALERMMAGDITDLAFVRAHLDAARGGWV